MELIGYWAYMDQHNWAEIPEEKLSGLISRQVIHTANMTIARLRLGKGALVAMHNHLNEQVTVVEAGALRFNMGGEQFDLLSGRTLVIPPDLPHEVEALEDSVVMDVFAPPRLDWIRGEDAYLRK